MRAKIAALLAALAVAACMMAGCTGAGGVQSNGASFTPGDSAVQAEASQTPETSEGELVVGGTASPAPSASSDDNMLASSDNQIVNPYNFQDFKFPLIASIPEKDIYLYSIDNGGDGWYGSVLFAGDTGYFYDSIVCIAPQYNLPQLCLADFDNDGQDELAVVDCYGTGTGVLIYGLHVIKINEKPNFCKPWPGYQATWPIYTYNPDNYLTQINKALSYKALDDSGTKFELSLGDEKKVIDLSPLDSGDYITDINVSGDISIFWFDGQNIRVDVAVGALHHNWAEPEFCADVYADVVFSDGTFSLTNMSFSDSGDND